MPRLNCRSLRHALLALLITAAGTGAVCATEMAELAAGLRPSDFTPRVEQLLARDRNAQALELAEIGISRNPRSAQLRFIRTVALERLGRTEEAAAALRSLIGEFPEIPEPYNNLARIEAALGNYEDALKLLDKAVLLNPNFATARKNRGDIYLALALEDYEAVAPALKNNTKLQRRAETLRRLIED